MFLEFSPINNFNKNAIFRNVPQNKRLKNYQKIYVKDSCPLKQLKVFLR